MKSILEDIGATFMAHIGRAMKGVNERLAGKADGSAIAAAVKKGVSGG